MWPISPPPSAAPTPAAPPPSPNRPAVRRPALSVKRLSTSAPITRTCSQRPASTWAAASESADRKPVQAAPTSIAPARSAPRSSATSGAALGSSSSAPTVATSTRSTSDAATPARSSAARPAAVARSWSRSPSDTCRRSRTPVRWTIHCSVTPAFSATVALVTTLSGTAIATDAIAAGRVARPALAGMRSRTGLRIGRLQVQRGLRLDAVERLAHEAGQHAARAGLHEAGGAAGLQRAQHVGPAHRVGQRRDQLLADVLEGRGGHARQHRHARLADLDLGDGLPEGP